MAKKICSEPSTVDFIRNTYKNERYKKCCSNRSEALFTVFDNTYMAILYVFGWSDTQQDWLVEL